MNNIPDVNIGTGWKSATRLAYEESLIIKVLKKAEGYHWYCLNLAKREYAVLPTISELMPAERPSLTADSSDIIYLSRPGITSFNLSSQRERLLVPIDWEMYATMNIWGSIDGPRRILYLLGARDQPWSQLVERARSSKIPIPTKFECSLHLWTADSAQSDLIFRFENRPGSVAVDWSRFEAFASMRHADQTNLMRINLMSKKTESIRKAPAGLSVAVSPRNRLLAWEHENPKISEIRPDGAEVVINEFGWFPSFSPDEQRLAFTVGDNELWLSESSTGKSERILALPESVRRRTHDVPTWCACGNHFCVCLAGMDASNQMKRTFVVVDCETKEILIHQNYSVTSEERIWVPSARVKDYSYAQIG